MKIKVIIKDKQHVAETLKTEGYQEDKLNSCFQTIKLECMAYANLVYWEILKKEPPQLITVNLVHQENDEKQPKAVAFLSQKSNIDHLLFEIHQPLIKRILDHPTDRSFATAMILEMMHAADHPTTERIGKVLGRLESKLNGDASNLSLLHTLQMLNSFRADSIAQLGKILLAQMKTEASVHELFVPFRERFDTAMKQAILGIEPTEDFRYDEIYIDDPSPLPDEAGPCLLLLALAKMGTVKEELVQEAFHGFLTGRYLERTNTLTILRAALSLSFADFIKGLLLLGEEYVPVRTILKYVSLLQKNGKEENMEALLVLLEQPHSVSTFNEVTEQIIGKDALSNDLDESYQEFCKDLPNSIDYPSLKASVGFLYRTMKTGENAKKKQIARNALAYFFADEKAIKDKITGFGRVDDLIVIDYATDLLKQCTS